MSFFDPDPDMDVAPLLTSVAVPTLVAHGREDRVVRFEEAEFMASRIRGARLHAFAGKGHVPTFTATAEFCAVLSAFIRTGTATSESRA
jgi:pimeloyl-ACP methyl ester carboxylesterase